MRFVLVLLAALALAGCTKPKPTAKVESPPDGPEMLVTLREGVTIKLVRLPAGKFVMGSPASEKGRGEDEGPARTVAISKPFYMAVTEITQAQYEAIITGENPSTFSGADRPVEEVSWEDATKFCEKLSRLTDRKFRLPTEAEWEYACRAGTRTAYCNGDTPADLKKVGHYAADPAASSGTHPVAGLAPNAWGLYDMHGNVWEWCSDWYGADYYASGNNLTDPRGPAAGTERILRGGSWSDEDPDECRCAYREGQPPGYSDDDIGFRIVCEE